MMKSSMIVKCDSCKKGCDSLEKNSEKYDSKLEIFDKLIPQDLTLVPQLNETYELELAYLESQVLSKEEIIRNGAYFSMVGDIPTRHFMMCSGKPLKLADHSSSKLKKFFQNNQFKTGYSTNGLFPYRGKFHPQMIKALINIMNIKKGDTVLDPMMGSGTVLIEAKLMGINSIGIDASPFCKFMAEAKIDALSVNLDIIKKIPPTIIYDYFSKKVGKPKQGSKIKLNSKNSELPLVNKQDASKDIKIDSEIKNIFKDEKIYNFLLLAYLDSAGYSERSNRKTPVEQFKSILERYIFVSEKIQKVLNGFESELGNAKPMIGDARQLEVADSFIDGIIFSPPYSFAIDYVKNDEFHLRKLNVDIDELKRKMVGLRGKKNRDKYELYLKDMDQILHESYRVLKNDKYCTIVVGTNRNQIARILEVKPKEVKGLDEIIIDLGTNIGFKWGRSIDRQITGIANTMRTEKIIMLKK